MPFRDAFTILQTPDLARAVAFYVEQLGFEERFRFGAFVVVGLDAFDLGLAETADVAPAGRAAVWLYSDDVDAELEALSGQIFLVTLVARLVTLWVRQGEEGDRQPPG